MNFKKAIFLFLALLLPIAVFLFLKTFGKNEFEVPLLFQEAVEKPAGCSSYEYAAPYVISDTVLAKFPWSQNDSLNLFVFDDASIENSEAISIQVTRLRTEFSSKELNLFTHADMNFRSCVFLLKPKDNAVIVDSNRRIRGQYNLIDLDEADRLIMEVKIILKEY